MATRPAGGVKGIVQALKRRRRRRQRAAASDTRLQQPAGAWKPLDASVTTYQRRSGHVGTFGTLTTPSFCVRVCCTPFVTVSDDPLYA